MRVNLGMLNVRRLLGAAGLGAAAAFLPFGVAPAQGPPGTQMQWVVEDDMGPDFDMRSVRRRGFDLFGSADAAFSGMRATGNYGTAITNYGDCDTTLRNCQNNRIRRSSILGGTGAPYFEVQWVYGAPVSQWVKIRNVAPSVVNATGGGWMAGYNSTVLGRPKRMGPHDGTLGRMFAGIASTDDGSCRDHTGFSNGNFLGGLQLLPTSDCAETWGSEGWAGAHPIDEAGFKTLFDAQQDDFRWDFWRVPESLQRLDKPFMGTRHHTYGETSDYSSDVLANYGNVVGGTGGPVYQGFPLGLKIHFDAFNFAVPTVASAYFVQALVINRSQDLWGAPINYDSLYFGFTLGTLFSNQNASRYALPEYGMTVYHNSNVQGAGGPCDAAFRRPDGAGCVGSGSASRGFASGVTGLIIFKSPLGDIRNKLFTRTPSGSACTPGTDPFCKPDHPNAGDTITFNRQAFGDFGGAEAATFGTGTQAAFGFLAGDEVNTLAGRSITDFNERTQWRTFRSERWPDQKDYYNKYVPPASPPWDWNKDGIPDTLALQTCGENGCAVAHSDTMPAQTGRFGAINRRGNIGGLQSFGPFSLKAGDTTSVIYAHIGEADSVQFWAQVNAVIDLYLNFYFAPEAPPPVRVASTSVVAGTDALGTANPSVRIFFTDEPERWVDRFLLKVADDVDNAATGTPLEVLRSLNPGLSGMLRARAQDNFHRLEIYKSCDGGSSFTADADCDGDPAVNLAGAADAFGWRAYSILDMDLNRGNIPNVFSDGNVNGGRTYLYVFIAKSRGATFLLNTATGPDSVSFAPSIRNPLSRSTSDPFVASVYVPASKPAGYKAATATFTTIPTATVPFTVDLSDNVASAKYRAVFGNRIVVQRDSNTAAESVFRTIVTVQRRGQVDAGSGPPVDSIFRAESFVLSGNEEFPVAGDPASITGPTLVAADTVRVTSVYDSLGFVLAGPNGPVFATKTLSGAAATPPALFALSTYPGFAITANNTVAGSHNAGAERQLRGATSIREQNLQVFDSVVPRGLVNSFMVQWVEASSVRAADGGGNYVVSWEDDPFGVGRGFRLNLTNPAATQAEVQSTLANRVVKYTGLTDLATAGLIGQDQADLVPVKLPFTIRNATFDRPVDIAMVRRLSDRIVLGNDRDTISVAIQEDRWVPGDVLFLIEDIKEDSTTAKGLVLGAGGVPLERTRRAVTFTAAILGCQTIRASCNPVLQGTRGATGYLPMRAGDKTRWEYYVPFSPATVYGFDVVAPVTGADITEVTDSALALIRVVPNPYVIFSQYQTSAAEGRVLFTNLPSRGTLRIYTVAAQLVQQITWDEDDLRGDGDLFYDLRSREGIDIASGLYLWVLTAPSDPSKPQSTPIQARGKFVVIRGDSR